MCDNDHDYPNSVILDYLEGLNRNIPQFLEGSGIMKTIFPSYLPSPVLLDSQGSPN